MRGFSVWYGSWKTICTRRRNARSSRSPADRGAVDLDRATGLRGTSPSIARASVDLPAARLPHDAQHLAGLPLERHAVDRAGGAVVDVQVADGEEAHQLSHGAK